MKVINKILYEINKEDIFDGSVSIPEGVEIIAGTVIYPKTLEKLVLPKSLVSIERLAFQNCKSLISVKGGKIQFIGVSAFQGCSRLGEFDFTEEIKRIEMHAFEGCNFEKINIYSADVEYKGFSSCEMLEEITMSKMASLRDSSFDNCSSLKNIRCQDESFSVICAEGSSFVNKNNVFSKGDIEVFFCYPMSRYADCNDDYIYVGRRGKIIAVSNSIKELVLEIQKRTAIQSLY